MLRKAEARRIDVHAHTLQTGEQRLHNDSAGLNYSRPGSPLDRTKLVLPRPNTRLEHIVAICSMTCFFGAFYVGPLTFFAAVAAVFTFRSTVAGTIAAAMLLDLVLPAGKEWRAFRDWSLFDIWRRYFRLCVIVPELPFLETDKKYLLAQFPHAAFPMAAFLTPALAGPPATGVAGPATGVVASILLQIPFFKHIFAWSACHAATKTNLMRLLKTSMVGMIPEGVAGIFEGATPSRERIFLKSRKGFIRVAIMAGVDVIPVYHFGNSQLMRYSGSEFVSRKLRATVGFFWAKYGLAPHPQQLITALGPPVKVVQSDNPSADHVDETHARFVAAIRDLYNEHRHLCGWQERDLELR